MAETVPIYPPFKEYNCAMEKKRNEIGEGYEQLVGEKGLKKQKIIDNEMEYLREDEELLRLSRKKHFDEHRKIMDDHKKKLAENRRNMDDDLKAAHKVLSSIDNIVSITMAYVKKNDIYESELKKITDEDVIVSAANSEIMEQIERNNLAQKQKRDAFNQLHINE
jgi:epoxyqueuosine reductase QueG